VLARSGRLSLGSVLDYFARPKRDLSALKADGKARSPVTKVSHRPAPAGHRDMHSKTVEPNGGIPCAR
jgi:hypothetical protein